MILEFVTVMTLGFAFGSPQPTMLGFAELNPAYGTSRAEEIGVCIITPSRKTSHAEVDNRVIVGFSSDGQAIAGDASGEVLSVFSSAASFGLSGVGGAYDILDSAHTIVLLSSPQYGELIEYSSMIRLGIKDYFYKPQLGFVGTDKVVFEVRAFDSLLQKNIAILVNYDIKITAEQYKEYLGNGWSSLSKKYCPEYIWRISSNYNSLSIGSIVNSFAWQQNPALSTLLSTATTAVQGFGYHPATGERTFCSLSSDF